MRKDQRRHLARRKQLAEGERRRDDAGQGRKQVASDAVAGGSRRRAANQHRQPIGTAVM